MAFRSKLSGVSRVSKYCCALALRCCLLLASWQGPIPWCHCHGALAADLEVANPSLVQHLQLRHPTLAGSSQLEFGWHMHCDFPGSPDDDPHHRSDHARCISPVIVPCDHALDYAVRPCMDCWILANVASNRTDEVSGSLAGSQHRTVHFFDAFAPTLALPLRFGVLNC